MYVQFTSCVYGVVYTFSRQSDEVLILLRNCLYLDFRYKIFKYQCNVRTQRTAQKIKFFIKDFSSKCDQMPCNLHS